MSKKAWTIFICLPLDRIVKMFTHFIASCVYRWWNLVRWLNEIVSFSSQSIRVRSYFGVWGRKKDIMRPCFWLRFANREYSVYIWMSNGCFCTVATKFYTLWKLSVFKRRWISSFSSSKDTCNFFSPGRCLQI